MKHIELIELLYKYRKLIDTAFGGEAIEDLPSELVKNVTIFQKVAKKYELSDTYVQFANAMLKRVDANYTFGDYNEEIKLLIRLKGDYLDSKDLSLISRIKELVRTLYKKIEQRDILINARINDIVNNNDLSIELIIKDAMDVDNRVSELIEAHSQNLKILSYELRGLDDELDEVLVDIGFDMLPLTQNIHTYNKRLSDFILRTKKRKLQNKKLSALSQKIMKEQDYECKSLLLSNPSVYHHTLKERKSANIKYLPSSRELSLASFVQSLHNILDMEKKQRISEVNKPYEVSPNIELKAIKLEKIQTDLLKDKPQDIYSYILAHSEILKFEDKQLKISYAFKTYLTIIQNNRKNISLNQDYNNSNIRIVKWI